MHLLYFYQAATDMVHNFPANTTTSISTLKHASTNLTTAVRDPGALIILDVGNASIAFCAAFAML